MVRKTTRRGLSALGSLGTLGSLGLLAGLGAPRLAAQSWALPASDPVGIARSGAGVAYGNSLEAASLNPALLATLRDGNSAYVGLGLEMMAAKATLQANQMVQYSTDRNQVLPSLGVAWRLNSDTVLGLKIDEPFMRHASMPESYTGRFGGQSFKLETHRLEGQLGWAVTPNWAFGASLGVTQIEYSWDNQIRTTVYNPHLTTSALGLMESDLHQEGKAYAPSYSLGFRWAPNSRWTLGGTYVGAISATLPLSAGYGGNGPSFYTATGNTPAPTGTSAAGTTQMGTTTVHSGSGGITLPGKLTLGVRQRLNTLFTWELDLRYVMGSATQLPGAPSATLASGTSVSGPGISSQFRNGVGGSLMGELTLTKRLVVRAGAALDPALRADNDVDPLVGGAKSSGFSAGMGLKAFHGEINVGYQYRQGQNVNTPNLDGAWTVRNGYQAAQGTTRVEGMGHLWSVGFKRTF